jgi:hypothetical protein
MRDAVAPRLSVREIELLRKVLKGEAFTMPSQQRVRLELLGIIRDGADGLIVTPEGKRLARATLKVELDDEPTQKKNVLLNRRGRRMPFQRKSVF